MTRLANGRDDLKRRAALRKGLQLLMLAPVLQVGTAPAPARAQSPVKAGASWVNEYGTVLRIDDVASNGRLSGTVTTRAGWGAGEAQPMTGWYFRHGGAITFSVYWDGCESLTAWMGRINTATGGFQAMWYVAGAAVPPGSGVVAGSNLFTPRESAAPPDFAKPEKKTKRKPKKKRRKRQRR